MKRFITAALLSAWFSTEAFAGGMISGQPLTPTPQIECDASGIDVTHPIETAKLVFATLNDEEEITRALTYDADGNFIRALVIEDPDKDSTFELISVFGTEIGRLGMDFGKGTGFLAMTDSLFIERGYEELSMSNCFDVPTAP